MKKEDFIEELNKLNDETRLINEKISSLESKYIDSNKRFNIGDRVYSNKKKTFGYVYGFELGFDFRIIPKVLNEKKDGTVSKVTMFVYSMDELTLSNK